MSGAMIECPHCHDANSCGDYEGPTCEVCMGEGKIPAVSPHTDAGASKGFCRCGMKLPLCEMRWCESPADWSVYQPAWPPRPASFVRICNIHLDLMRKPIPGIDRPERADDSWRPSLMDMMRQARIANSFEQRSKRAMLPKPRPDYDYSPSDIRQIHAIANRLLREFPR